MRWVECKEVKSFLFHVWSSIDIKVGSKEQILLSQLENFLFLPFCKIKLKMIWRREFEKYRSKLNYFVSYKL